MNEVQISNWKENYKQWSAVSVVLAHTLQAFEKGGFTLETHQMFSIHITPEEFKHESATIAE